jgi:hypothetical protein
VVELESNVPSGDLTTLDTTNLKFNNNPNLNATTANYIFGSIAVKTQMLLMEVKQEIHRRNKTKYYIYNFSSTKISYIR